MSFIEIPEGVIWPPPALPITGPSAVGGSVVFSGRCLLMGFSVAGGAAAGGFDLFDGFDVTAQPLGTWEATVNQALWPWFGDHGIYCRRGLFCNTTAALTDLVFFVAPLWRPGN